jgi:hypothetical protein
MYECRVYAALQGSNVIYWRYGKTLKIDQQNQKLPLALLHGCHRPLDHCRCRRHRLARNRNRGRAPYTIVVCVWT